MNTKQLQPIIEVFSVAALIYVIHKIIFWFLATNPLLQNFHFSLEIVYGFFLICSLLIVGILIKIKIRSIDNVGFVYILVTFIKMGLAYFLLSAITDSGESNIRNEKINFFIVFAIFLAIETIATIRILRDNQ